MARSMRMVRIWHGLKHVMQDLPGRLSVSRCNELSDGELGRSVNAHKEIELAFSRLQPGDVDVDRAIGAPLVQAQWQGPMA